MRGLKITNLRNLSLLITAFTNSVWVLKMHGQRETVICNSNWRSSFPAYRCTKLNSGYFLLYLIGLFFQFVCQKFTLIIRRDHEVPQKASQKKTKKKRKIERGFFVNLQGYSRPSIWIEVVISFIPFFTFFPLTTVSTYARKTCACSRETPETQKTKT